MRHPHKWEHLRPEEFFAEFERAPIAYWAAGAMEDHGLHNALGVDPVVAYHVCLRAAEISGGIVFPAVPFAPAGIPGLSRDELRSGKHQLFYPSLWVSRELCQRIYLELLESLADLGFKSCVALGGHYPALLLISEIEEQCGGRIAKMRFSSGRSYVGPPAAEESGPEADSRAEGHGLMKETSMFAAICPECVDLSRAPYTMESPIPSQLQEASAESIAYLQKATPEVGRRLIAREARRLAALAREMLEA